MSFQTDSKSTVTAIMALHEALYSSSALVLLLSPSLRQSQELFRKLLHAYGAVANKPPSLQESSLRLELPNGSRIVSLPGKEETVRGFSGRDPAGHRRSLPRVGRAVLRRPPNARGLLRSDRLPLHAVWEARLLLRGMDKRPTLAPPQGYGQMSAPASRRSSSRKSAGRSGRIGLPKSTCASSPTRLISSLGMTC